MIALKVEKIGDQVAVVLTEEAQRVLKADVGCTLQIEPSSNGVLRATTQEQWLDDHHARGRAFLKRYNRSLRRLEA